MTVARATPPDPTATHPTAPRVIGAGFAVLACLIAATPAVADVIDGDWCHDDGRRFSISGPSIVTPGGAHLQGQYTRHSFRYVAPAPEPESGQDVAMVLLNETTVRLQAGPGEAQIWHRCKPETS